MRLSRLAALAGVASALLAAGPGRAATAHAATAPLTAVARCGDRSGTLVAVDFAAFGGPIVRGCALRAQTAQAALQAGGFTTDGDAHDGSGFVCRLASTAFHHDDPYPSAAAQSCLNTPAASAYWSSWVAAAGARRFAYSQLGVDGEPARAGEIQLWMFGATDIAGTHGSGVPRFTPAALRASARGATLDGARVLDAGVAPAPGSAGSATGVIVGLGAALVLAVAGGVTARRRRTR